jgi:hypothetical protein
VVVPGGACGAWRRPVVVLGGSQCPAGGDGSGGGRQPAAGPALVFFLFFCLSRVSTSAHDKDVGRRLHRGASSVAFVCRASPVVHDKEGLHCVSE